MEKLKKETGVTIIILVITIVVLAILAGATISSSRNTITETKIYNFTSQLEMVQKKMLIINKEIDLGSEIYENIGTKYENLDDDKKQKVKQILEQNGITEYSNYVYMSIEDLLKIGLKNMEQNVIISYGNSDVYSYDGIEIDGKMYYSLEELTS